MRGKIRYGYHARQEKPKVSLYVHIENSEWDRIIKDCPLIKLTPQSPSVVNINVKCTLVWVEPYWGDDVKSTIRGTTAHITYAAQHDGFVGLDIVMDATEDAKTHDLIGPPDIQNIIIS